MAFAKEKSPVATMFQQIPQDMYPRPPKLASFERPAWLEFCRIWVAYSEDCADLGVKVSRICKSFEGSVAVSVRSTLEMGHFDDLSSEWRAVTWDAVRAKVDEHFRLTAGKDDLRPVYAKALVLDSYDSFRSMHVSLTVFVSALAKKDAELGKDALPVKTKRDIVKKALELSPLCKFWLENLTFDTATEMTSFLLDNVKECEVFERKFGHAPGCRTHPIYKKGAEVKLHNLRDEVDVAVQKAMAKLPKSASDQVVPLSAISETRPKSKSKWPVHSGPTGCGRSHPEGDCYFVGKCKDGKITCSKEERDRIMRSHLGNRQGSTSRSGSSPEPSPPDPARFASSKKKQRRQRTPSPHPNAGAENAGADTNKSEFYSCPPRVSCCCAHMFLEASEAVSAMLDTGTLANFVDPCIAERYRAAAEVQPWARRIRTGDKSLGTSSERIQLSVTREKGSVQTTTKEWFIIFPTGFDMIIGLPPLERWGWVQWGDIRQSHYPTEKPSTSVAFLSEEGLEDSAPADSLHIALWNVSDRARSASAKWDEFPQLPTSGGQAGLRPSKAHRLLSDDIPEGEFWSEKRRTRRQEVSDAQWRRWQSESFWKQRNLSLRVKRKKGGLKGSSGKAGPVQVSWVGDDADIGSGAYDQATIENTEANAVSPTVCLLQPEGFGNSTTTVGKPRVVRFAFNAVCSPKTKFIGTRWAARRTGAVPAAVLMSLHTESQEYQLRAQACRLKGDEAGFQFYIDLDDRCARAGKYDKKGIFSETCNSPAKADDMVIRLMPGADNNLWRFHCPTRRYTPPQQAEIRRQLAKMLRMAVIERAGPDAVVSAVHLARKPSKPEAPQQELDATSLNSFGVSGAHDVDLWTLSEVGEIFPVSRTSVGSAVSERFCTLSEAELQYFASQCGGRALEDLTLWAASADVKGADGVEIKWRFCIDFRRINSVTVDEYYPMPTDRECIEYLAGGELFGSSDVSAMYWQFGLAPESRHLTAFATEDGVWQFRRVPFGLKNAVAFAQASMRRILRSDERLRHVWNYIDDTFWATKGETKYNDYLAIVDALFEVCAKFNVRLSADKTHLGRDSLNVLGHRVDRTGVRIDESRKSALCNFKRPSDAKEVLAFIGATGYVRSFIPDFSTVAYPLTGMKKFVWGTDQERAFNKLKELIRSADVLCNPDYRRDFFLKGDASEKGCGAVLFQLDEKGQRRVIAYASKKFCLRESKWRVMERELFSIIFGLQRFRCFVQGCAIHVVNDHRNLVWLKSNDTSSKLTRWSLVLDEIAIKSWSHAPGSEMGVEDGLSRGGGEEPGTKPPEMSERERILLEEEDIQLSALRALGTSMAQSRDASDPDDDASLNVDLEVEAEVLLSTLVALRQSWLAESALHLTNQPPSQSDSVSGASTSVGEAERSSALSPRLVVAKRVGARAARATPEFISSSAARRDSMRSRTIEVNARAGAAHGSPTDDRERRRAARAAVAEAAVAAESASNVAAAEQEAALKRALAVAAALVSTQLAAAAAAAAKTAEVAARAASAPPSTGSTRSSMAAAQASRRAEAARRAVRVSKAKHAEAELASQDAAAAEAEATAAETRVALAQASASPRQPALERSAAKAPATESGTSAAVTCRAKPGEATSPSRVAAASTGSAAVPASASDSAANAAGMTSSATHATASATAAAGGFASQAMVAAKEHSAAAARARPPASASETAGCAGTTSSASHSAAVAAARGIASQAVAAAKGHSAAAARAQPPASASAAAVAAGGVASQAVAAAKEHSAGASGARPPASASGSAASAAGMTSPATHATAAATATAGGLASQAMVAAKEHSAAAARAQPPASASGTVVSAAIAGTTVSASHAAAAAAVAAGGVASQAVAAVKEHSAGASGAQPAASASDSKVDAGTTASVAVAEKQGRRTTAQANLTILSSKEKEGALSAAAKTMMQQARRLAATARAVAVDNVRWRQARQTEGPVAYDGQIRQREAQREGALGITNERSALAGQAETGSSDIAQPRREPRVLLEWSTLSEARKREFFEKAHLFPNDHPGVVQTVKRLMSSGRFSLERGEYGRMFEDVTRWRRACPVCQMLQEARSQDAPVSAIPSRPFFDTSVDFLDIAADVEGHTSVCAVVDNFSGFTQLYPCKRKDAKTAVRCLLRTFADMGKPCTLRSDQGPSFENHVCNEFNRRMGITSYRTIPHHHQSNGIVEKVNGRALRMLSACVLDPKCQPNVRAQWADVLPFVQLAINRTVHARTRVAPCSLIYGEGFLDLGRGLFDSDSDGNIFTTEKRLISSVSPDVSYVTDIAQSQQAVLERAMASHSEYLAKALAGRQVVSAETYIPGQYVLVDFPSDESREKLTPRWTGPFKVLKQSGSNTYTVLDSVRGGVRDVATAQLVRFNWDWFEGVEGDESAMQEHARKLAALAPQTPKLTPKAIVAARARKTKSAAARILNLEAGRGQLKLASCEFQVSFEEDVGRLDWLSVSQLEDEPVFHAFLNEFPSWREGSW